MTRGEALEECARRLADSDVVIVMVRRGHLMPLLPLLEFEHERVGARLASLLIACGEVGAQLADAISLRDLVNYAFTEEWCSSHWVGCAVSWCEAGFALDGELLDALESIATRTGLAQGVRHRAFGLAKREKRHRAMTQGD